VRCNNSYRYVVGPSYSLNVWKIRWVITIRYLEAPIWLDPLISNSKDRQISRTDPSERSCRSRDSSLIIDCSDGNECESLSIIDPVERNDSSHLIMGIQALGYCNESIKGLSLVVGGQMKTFIRVNVGKGKFSCIDMTNMNSRRSDLSP
jgi:hypothetical protein